jgi:hypothetical protein
LGTATTDNYPDDYVPEDAEIVGELVHVPHAPVTLFGTDEPEEIVAKASRHADALMDIVKKKGLTVNIQGKQHPLVECWTLLGSMVGVFPVIVWTRPVEADGKKIGWEARCEARTRAGEVVGAAEAECLTLERRWGKADDYAVRSMAQTRSISKALRMPLGFIVQLAGLAPTPAEEMDFAREPAMSMETAKELEAVLTIAETHDEARWGDEVVLANASRKFGRVIQDYSDLTDREGQVIIAGATAWLETR